MLRNFVRILGRLIAVTLAYMIACFVAGIMVVGSYVVRAWLEGSGDFADQRLFVETLYFGGLAAAFVSVYAFTPAVIAIVVAEVFAIRRPLYYVICGGLAGAIGYVAFSGYDTGSAALPVGRAMILLAGAGCVAGYVYWYLAGRSAGVLKRPTA
jgi:hypothetical protein